MELRVEGMKCLACCARVKSSILAIPGVQTCSVDFESRLVRVDGHAMAHKRVLEVLEGLGYQYEVSRSDRVLKTDLK